MGRTSRSFTDYEVEEMKKLEAKGYTRSIIASRIGTTQNKITRILGKKHEVNQTGIKRPHVKIDEGALRQKKDKAYQKLRSLQIGDKLRIVQKFYSSSAVKTCIVIGTYTHCVTLQNVLSKSDKISVNISDIITKTIKIARDIPA